MKNIMGFFKSNDVKLNGFELLNAEELFKVRGGTEPVKPVSRPKDFYDEEEQ